MENKEIKEIGLLENKKLECFDNIDFYKIAKITDFAVLLGGYCNRHEKLLDDILIFSGDHHFIVEGGNGYWWLNDTQDNEKIYINSKGDLEKGYSNNSAIGIRPTINYSLLENEKAQNSIIEYFEYPQYLTSYNIGRRLEKRYKKGTLKETGKHYTAFDNDGFPISFTEYEYDEKKYIRFVCNLKDIQMLSNEKYTELNKAYWIEVQPIKWMVSEDKNICLSKDILLANVHNIKWFLTNYFIKEIKPIDQQNISYDSNFEKQINDNVSYIYNCITQTKNSEIKTLSEIDQISELFLRNIENIPFDDRINIARQISSLYLHIVSEYNIDKMELENNIYVLYLKKYLYLFIKEMLEKEIIVVNDYINNNIKNNVSLVDIVKIISEMESFYNDVKRLRLQ